LFIHSYLFRSQFTQINFTQVIEQLIETEKEGHKEESLFFISIKFQTTISIL